MSDDISDIASYYDEDPEREALRLELHQLERDLTWRYLDQHLVPGCSILEIGAGTGAYTVPLAQRGHSITALDLSAELLAEAERRVAEKGLEDRVRFVVRDARNLRGLTDDRFGAVLMNRGAGFGATLPAPPRLRRCTKRLALRRSRSRA